MKKKAIYPGSFDPITFGHLDLLKRSCKLFDDLTIAVVVNPHKKALFTVDERVAMIKMATKKYRNVKIDKFDGLLVDYAKKVKANVIIRGLRAIADFEYEFQMALVNRSLYKPLDMVYMMPSVEYTYLSSSIVREVASLGGDVSGFVSTFIAGKLKEKFNNA
ncbi:MAG: pantetheine-phosphate adenylyltransferase [Candidatus Firestonebacteria bacterium]|nr:pantetheine-phosphate adenylyltransferase [Candidatus Firestonebacteria bacterium]